MFLSFYPQQKRRDLAEAFVELFTKGDNGDKVRAVSLLLEAIEGRVKEEIKRV